MEKRGLKKSNRAAPMKEVMETARNGMGRRSGEGSNRARAGPSWIKGGRLRYGKSVIEWGKLKSSKRRPDPLLLSGKDEGIKITFRGVFPKKGACQHSPRELRLKLTERGEL